MFDVYMQLSNYIKISAFTYLFKFFHSIIFSLIKKGDNSVGNGFQTMIENLWFFNIVRTVMSIVPSYPSFTSSSTPTIKLEKDATPNYFVQFHKHTSEAFPVSQYSIHTTLENSFQTTPLTIVSTSTESNQVPQRLVNIHPQVDVCYLILPNN